MRHTWAAFGLPSESLPPAAYATPHASPLAQRARKAETGPDAVLKLAQRTRRTTATRTAAGPPAPGRASGVQTATPETSSSGGPKAPPAARERTRMPGTITTRPPEPGRHGREGKPAADNEPSVLKDTSNPTNQPAVSPPRGPAPTSPSIVTITDYRRRYPDESTEADGTIHSRKQHP